MGAYLPTWDGQRGSQSSWDCMATSDQGPQGVWLPTAATGRGHTALWEPALSAVSGSCRHTWQH